MAQVLAGLTMSLDGFIAGPHDGLGAGLGKGGERLHYWIFGGPWSYDSPAGMSPSPAGADKEYLDQLFGSAGAWVAGRAMHDGIDGWGDDPGFGVPLYIVTRRPHPTVVKGNTTFEFVTDGAATALAKAKAAADGKNVIVMGGANLLNQYLAAGEIDELTVTIAPIVLGAGKRFFDGTDLGQLTFDRLAVIESEYATHIRYRVSR
jgi:dihydrofolate reductase